MAFHYQRARWEAVRTGIALGAEEVQDQRLSAAEAPPEAKPGLELLLVVFTVLLEGPVAGWIARGLQAGLVSALRAEIKLQREAYRALLVTEGAGVAPVLREAHRIAATRAASMHEQRSMFTAMVAERSTSNRESWLRHSIKEADAADRELASAVQRLRAAAIKGGTDFGGMGTTRTCQGSPERLGTGVDHRRAEGGVSARSTTGDRAGRTAIAGVTWRVGRCAAAGRR